MLIAHVPALGMPLSDGIDEGDKLTSYGGRADIKSRIRADGPVVSRRQRETARVNLARPRNTDVEEVEVLRASLNFRRSGNMSYQETLEDSTS